MDTAQLTLVRQPFDHPDTQNTQKRVLGIPSLYPLLSLHHVPISKYPNRGHVGIANISSPGPSDNTVEGLTHSKDRKAAPIEHLCVGAVLMVPEPDIDVAWVRPRR